MDAAASPILEFKDVNLKYGDVWALRNISLSLRPSETYIIFGAAGSGKTTLLKSAVGLVTIDTGSITLFGEDVTRMKERDWFRRRGRAGFLFQEGGLFDSLSIADNVAYPLLNQQSNRNGKGQVQDIDEHVREALRFVDLEQTIDKFPSQLSGGMRRRVGIARAIVTDPPLVLYDSPTAGLDPITANMIMALVAKQRDIEDSASLIVTHRYQDGEIMASYHYDPEHKELRPMNAEEQANDGTKFLVMREGEIVFLGGRQELESSREDYVKRFVKEEN